MMSCSRRTPVPSGTTPISRREEPLVRRFAVIRLAPGGVREHGSASGGPFGPAGWVRGSPRDGTRFRCGDPGDEVGDRGDQDRGPKSECHGGVRTPFVSEDGETDEVDHR